MVPQALRKEVASFNWRLSVAVTRRWYEAIAVFTEPSIIGDPSCILLASTMWWLKNTMRALEKKRLEMKNTIWSWIRSTEASKRVS
ncbi:hypothetical protein JHK82_036776 [Glycine max]|uniref:Uncharacterized protein n=2 Tax=Glycine subgen. Soja TaxID=1462606 RepID=A0A0R0H157_SOYBN|nr:hypothetical protein JHK87_036724 [Glycine soja]KAG4971106.1 hypothetical protein JHK85_037527 [Glycine max]KAG4977506.1 hypothetical protein JHK86_036980 [Glycine max]KAG5113507.1 hypothetical protein JHK82_036776 [Glycine max]KAG5130784.1 hypothetical protein JHK84_037181 [Glycine max]